ncbi:MAG: hypothetical protein GY856_46580 [bacterium]|nr:hypothetical protein [bacterium]
MQTLQTQTWHRIKSIVEAALDEHPESWPSFVDETCAGDVDLHREVTSLLEASRTMGDVFETPAAEILRKQTTAGR